MPDTKVCKDCNRILPATPEYFVVSKQRKKNYLGLCIQCSRLARTRWRYKLRIEVFSAYSKGKPVCNCCGESNIGFLTLDHVNNDGAKHRKEVGSGVSLCSWAKRNKYPKTLQVLCYNCNCAKQFCGFNECPHNIEREELLRLLGAN